jgi:hypothetical protein
MLLDKLIVSQLLKEPSVSDTARVQEREHEAISRYLAYHSITHFPEGLI